MKTFVVLLLLTNLLYWGWINIMQDGVPQALRAPDKVAEEPVPFEQAPTQLKLLSELDPGDIRQAETVNTGSLASSQESPELPAIAAEAGEAAVVPIDASMPEVQQTDEPVPEPVPWCAQSGFFVTEREVRSLITGLQALDMGIDAVPESGEVPVSYTYWVHMPDFASEQEALQQLAEFQQKGIDSYYMRSGELAGGISLGVFSRRESAELVRSSLADQGYTAEIGQIARQERRYWLLLRMSDSAGLESPDWAAFRQEHNALNLSEKVCEVVASATQFP